MVGMFATRRLIESGKCSSLLPTRRTSVIVHPRTSDPHSVIGTLEPEQFDLSSKQQTQLPLSRLYEQFIHSRVLTLWAEGDLTLAGVFVASDSTSKTSLYQIDIASIIELYKYVGTEDVAFWYQGEGCAYRLSQHDLVVAGFAEYEEGGTGTRCCANSQPRISKRCSPALPHRELLMPIGCREPRHLPLGV